MATFEKGILGGFSGKVGNVVGGTWKGKSYMRSVPGKRTKPSSVKQLVQQAKFSLIVLFFHTFSGLLNLSFRSFAVKVTGFNSAVAYGLKNAVTGNYPAFDIAYPQVLIARGDLPNATNPKAAATGSGFINFDWVSNAGVGLAKATDKTILLIYCPALKQAIYTVGSSTRITVAEKLDVSPFTGQGVETYISFISEDEKDVATSVYTGHVQVS